MDDPLIIERSELEHYAESRLIQYRIRTAEAMRAQATEYLEEATRSGELLERERLEAAADALSIAAEAIAPRVPA